MRNFRISDDIVLGQLRELERLSVENGRDGDFSLIHTLIVAVIGTIEALPKRISAQIRTSFYVGNSHEGGTNAQRLALWNRLRASLADDLDRLATDTNLAEIDLTDRRKTKGEAIIELCDQLDDARRRGGDMLRLARKLATAGVSTDAAFDGEQLVRHLSKKHIPDLRQHEYEIVRLISHARIVGGMHHNRPAER